MQLFSGVIRSLVSIEYFYISEHIACSVVPTVYNSQHLVSPTHYCCGLLEEQHIENRTHKNNLDEKTAVLAFWNVSAPPGSHGSGLQKQSIKKRSLYFISVAKIQLRVSFNNSLSLSGPPVLISRFPTFYVVSDAAPDPPPPQLSPASPHNWNTNRLSLVGALLPNHPFSPPAPPVRLSPFVCSVAPTTTTTTSAGSRPPAPAFYGLLFVGVFLFSHYLV